jgi:Tfp pilus assembly protein PilN
MPGSPSRIDWKKFIAVGSGIGVEIGAKDLEVTAVRVRPNGIAVLGTTTIRDFAQRPAAEWGKEYTRFLQDTHVAHLAATVLLPRREIIVRQIALPGVEARDLASAIALQIEALHPYGDEPVAYGWSRAGAGGILIGVLRQTVLDRFCSLFAEAGIAVASFTFSASAIYAAHRVPSSSLQADGDGFVALNTTGGGVLEVYGESPSRPVFSAEFDPPADRAVALAISELRLDPALEPVPLDRALPVPRVNPVSNNLALRALPYAAALAGACPWLAPSANLLPVAQRRSNSRVMYVPTIALAALLLLVLAALALHSSWEDRQYLADLDTQIKKVEPRAKRAVQLDRELIRVQNRTRLLDEFRARTKQDLDALDGLTTLLAPPVWTSIVDLAPDAASITGEAEQAAPLLKVLDASPYFQASAFQGPIAKAPGAAGIEQFQIRASRRPRP